MRNKPLRWTKTGEAPATTNEAMFAIMNDRLADLDELLLSDTSPREAWAGITHEKVLRREIARELHHSANGLYVVDQEAVTADENRTDIRLRSVVSDHEAVIELKRANGNWSARVLRDKILQAASQEVHGGREHQIRVPVADIGERPEVETSRHREVYPMVRVDISPT